MAAANSGAGRPQKGRSAAGTTSPGDPPPPARTPWRALWGEPPSASAWLAPFNAAVLVGGGLVAVAAGLAQAGPVRPPPASTLLAVVLLQPLLEELFFRGCLQGELLRRRALRRRALGISGANAATTIAFAGLHLLHNAPAHALLVAVPSLVYGHARERYRGVTIPALQHVVHNACLVMTFVIA